MELKVEAIGNLTADAVVESKDPQKEYVMLNIAVNKSKSETIYITSFVYGVSKDRVKLLKKGTMVRVYGNYSDSIYTNPSTQEVTINRVVNCKDLDIILLKKEDTNN